jgi:DNA-directed RNA polymerase specialized sigma24 family protein
LLQELRLALWLAGPEVRVNPTWIYQTAIHKAADSIERTRRSRAAPNGILHHHPALRDPDLSHLLRSRADRLPKELKLYFTLRYKAGFSQREIAARLGLCRSSVRWLDVRCLRLIKGRRRLEPQRNLLP